MNPSTKIVQRKEQNMKVIDIVNWENTTVLAGKDACEKTISGAYSSDLLSDVMGNADENMLWITIQTHKNVAAIASLKELACVVIANNNKASAELIESAEREGIPIISTSMSAFEFGGRLYQVLHS